MNHIDDERLALYAGGDLTDEEAARVTDHLRECRECRTALEELSLVRDFGELAGADVPPVSEGDLTERVMSRIEENAPRGTRTGGASVRWWHVAAAAAAIVLVGLMLVDSPTERNSGDVAEHIQRDSVHERAGVKLDGALLQLLPIEGPYRLGGSVPDDFNGVFLLLSRIEPSAYGDRYEVEFIGSGDMKSGLECISSAPGALGEIYYVLYKMPESTPEQREHVAQALIQAYKPYCNSGV